MIEMGMGGRNFKMCYAKKLLIVIIDSIINLSFNFAVMPPKIPLF